MLCCRACLGDFTRIRLQYSFMACRRSSEPILRPSAAGFVSEPRYSRSMASEHQTPQPDEAPALQLDSAAAVVGTGAALKAAVISDDTETAEPVPAAELAVPDAIPAASSPAAPAEEPATEAVLPPNGEASPQAKPVASEPESRETSAGGSSHGAADPSAATPPAAAAEQMGTDQPAANGGAEQPLQVRDSWTLRLIRCDLHHSNAKCMMDSLTT